MRHSTTYSLCVVLFLLGFAAGCFQKSVESIVAESNKSNAQRLANCYGLYQQRNSFKGPKDKDSFLAFLKEPAQERNLTVMGIDPAAIDQLFVSDRDNEEMTVRYGMNTTGMGPYHAVVFEKTGVDGVRLVAYTSSKVDAVMDDAQYKALLTGKAKPETVTRSESSEE